MVENIFKFEISSIISSLEHHQFFFFFRINKNYKKRCIFPISSERLLFKDYKDKVFFIKNKMRYWIMHNESMNVHIKGNWINWFHVDFKWSFASEGIWWWMYSLCTCSKMSSSLLSDHKGVWSCFNIASHSRCTCSVLHWK